ncbi:SEC-C domain-containing protein [Lysinibacillus capsici]|uniref:SEC-C domain-containing protein n=1 Tax=Lysinibacillus capsici TaxID=2115968 RepID=UPI0032DFD620
MSEFTYEGLKKYIREKDLQSCAKEIIGLFLIDGKKFYRNFMLSGCLTDPLSRKFKNEELEFFFKACQLVHKSIEHRDEEFSTDFKDAFIKIISTINDIHRAERSNEGRLFKNDFLNYPFTKQVQMMCTFIESQSFYVNKKMSSKIKSQGYVTGMEYELPETEIQVSVADVMENNIEIMDTLIRLLHFTANGKIDNQEIKSFQDISPYGIPSLQEIMYLALHRDYLEELWSKVKYRGWNFTRHQIDKKVYAHYYSAPIADDYKKERAAVQRYKYRDYINYGKRNDFKKMSYSIKEIEQKSNFSLSSPSSVFSLEREVFQLGEQVIEGALNVSIRQLNEDLGSLVDHIMIGQDKNISLSELYEGFKYLLSLAFVYRTNSHSHFADDDFTYLTPIFELKELESHFAELSGLGQEKAKKIIELFVFRPKPLLDIFSQPLIYIGDERIVFTPELVLQFNMNRIVGRHLSHWDINISAKGTELEKEIIEVLSLAPHFSVNTSKVKFEAYDGRDVEYDLIATFDNKVVLIELKCLNRPFSSKEIKQREDEILYGVTQINRRADILINQWDKVQQYMNIPLPKTPIVANDIIKIVCTNIFDFSGRIESGVYITDVSSFLKFFLDPKVEEIKLEAGSRNVISQQKLWTGEPKIKDLINYLKCPITIEGLLNKLAEVPRKNVIINEDDPHLAIQDFVLDGNPFDFAALSKSKGSYLGEKVGRNDPCPCDSGKKFKKCHGQ